MWSDYLVNPDQASDIFSSPEFMETQGVRRYFLSSGEDVQADKVYEVIDEVFDFYSEILGRARKRTDLRLLAINEREAIPIPLSYVTDYCKEPVDSEAPKKLIVDIAESDYANLKQLLDNPRKILRRERELVPLDRLQQVDNYCIRWMARQPGYTAEQKAGTKQKVMGIVRHETLDTLENRVLKRYMQYCLSEGIRYLRKYSPHYKDSKRCLIVRRFMALVKAGLMMPEFRSVRTLESIPRPNYTLQNNRLYSSIWRSYLLLAQHVSEIELLWKHRHLLLHEVIMLVAMAAVDDSITKDSGIVHDIWLNQHPDADGVYRTARFMYLDFSKSPLMSYRIYDSDGKINFQCRHAGRDINSQVLRFCFIPRICEVGDIPQDRKTTTMVFCEDDDSCDDGCASHIGGSRESDIVQDIYRVVSRWIGG